jgi:hypothetical protein
MVISWTLNVDVFVEHSSPSQGYSYYKLMQEPLFTTLCKDHTSILAAADYGQLSDHYVFGFMLRSLYLFVVIAIITVLFSSPLHGNEGDV